MSNPLLEVLLQRASCRNFLSKDIDDSLLARVLEAGVRAASGGNLQPWSAIIVRNQETKDRLMDLCGKQTFIGKAPVNILFCIDQHRLAKWAELELAPFTATHSFRHFWIAFQDTVISAQSICTAADALGLASVYVGTVLECFRELKDLFELPQGVFPVVLLCLGWPKQDAKMKSKLSQEILFHQEKYQNPQDSTLLAAMNEKYKGLQFPLTEKNLAILKDVCLKVQGPEFAEKCLAKVQKQGFISRAQYYFGLHYSADTMAEGNEEFLNTLHEFGFTWAPTSPRLD